MVENNSKLFFSLLLNCFKSSAKPFFVFTDVPLRFCKTFPLFSLAFSFDFTETPSPQRYHAEPSPSRRRRLAKSMPSLRQLVESKGTLQSIPKFDSDYPRKRFSKSTHTIGLRRAEGSAKTISKKGFSFSFKENHEMSEEIHNFAMILVLRSEV